MTPFGFGPPDDENSNNANNGGQPDFNEIMRQMQSEFQKIAPQFGFMNPAMLFGGVNQGALPKEVIREVAKSFIQAQGSQPIGAKEIGRHAD